MKEYIAPSPTRQYFTCPHCNEFRQQITIHTELSGIDNSNVKSSLIGKKRYLIKECESCSRMTCWDMEQMIYPDMPIMEANPDMPDGVKILYNEAGLIANKSPRAACALLRLSVEKLCNIFNDQKQNLNGNIANLVKKGLSPDIQKALDIVRVIGNTAVHPGTIDLDVDDERTARNLFKLLNLIVDKMITEKKAIDAIYADLPESTKNAINKRDGSSTASSES